MKSGCLGTGGYGWSDSSTHLNGPITAIRIKADDLYIRSIQIKYGETLGILHGGDYYTHLKLETFTIPKNDNITQVIGRADAYVDRLQFKTSLGSTSKIFGGSGGKAFSAKPDGSNCTLSYISGRSDDWMDNITFHWLCQPEGQDAF